MFKKLLCSFTLLALLTVGSSCLAADPVAVQPVTPGKINQLANGIKIVTLNGSYHDMGVQYGNLLQSDLKYWVQQYKTIWAKVAPGMSSDLTKHLIDGVNTPYASKKLKDFVAGMADGSGINKADLFMLDYALTFDFVFNPIGDAERNIINKLFPKPACTFVSAYGTTSNNGHTLIGRNLDLQKSLAIKDYNSIVTIMHPNNRDHKVATLGFVGFPAGYALINLDNNVFVEYNTGNSSASGYDLTPGSLDLINLSFNAVTEPANTDAKSTATYLKNKPTLSPAFFGVADRNSVYAVQHPIKGARMDTDTMAKGLVAFTNVYLNAGQGITLTINNASQAVNGAQQKLDTPARGMVRYQNIVNFAQGKQTAKEKISLEDLKTLISTDLSDGGTFIGGYEQQGTKFYCEDDSTLGAVALDLSDLSKVYWLRYDYKNRIKGWDVVSLLQ